ncbi:hypothetical protein B0H10DRAFT_1978077 [Mycena sp. CBHHK59/15]|nr:hypothetical protein B0H10DRAFT_1978077 [Mycena sp. CBHHK59/15]
MITDANLTHGTSRSMMSRPLKRGRACMNCRFLKIKCDGQKPICGPCRKHPKDDDCEYSDGPARSRTKALEDTVSRLEARLHELEHPEESTPSVTLYDPYNQYHPLPQLTLSPSHPSSSSLPNTPFHQLPRLLSPTNSSPDSQVFTPLSPFSPPSTIASTPPFGTQGHGSSPLGIFDSRAATATPSDSSSSIYGFEVRAAATHLLPTTDRFNQPTIEHIQALLQVFLAHATEFGFFLHPKRFYDSALLLESSTRPSPALLNAAYMWGAHFSPQDGFSGQEDRYLHQALQYAATDLSTSHPQSFLHAIQAEVLISFYFFRTGRFLEARAHTGTAVALALGGGLHQIRSVHHHDAPIIGVTSDHAIQLRSPADDVEEGERINGFWAVFMLQKNLAVALEPAARVCGVFEAGGMQIDTPWPLDIDSYKQGLLTSDIRGDSTVRNFLGNPGTPSYGDATSLMAMNTKACILLHRAVYMQGQWVPNLSPREAQSLSTAFQTVDQLITSLRTQLPNFAQLDGRSSARTILLTRSLLNAATIKLHSIFMYSDPTSRQNCLDAARDMFRFGDINLQGLGYLNPMMGTLWMTACSVFVDELKRILSVQTAWPTSTASGSEEEMRSSLEGGLAALSVFAHDSLLMSHQLTKAREALGAL